MHDLQCTDSASPPTALLDVVACKVTLLRQIFCRSVAPFFFFRSVAMHTMQCSRGASRYLQVPPSGMMRVRQLRSVALRAVRLPSSEAVVKLEQGYTYVDVRTPQEYEAGHPPGSINIPFMQSTPQGMQMNPAFLQEIKGAFPDLSTPLVIACKGGNRSARACALLEQEQYQDLVDTSDGYDGWVAANLPVEK